MPDVLVTYEVVGEPKVRRLAALARHARVAAIADHPDQVAAYSRAAGEFGVTLSVMVDIYGGGPRTGVEVGKPVLDLAIRIAGSPSLRFGGLQAYNGAAQHVRDHAERRAAYAAYAGKVRETRQLLEDAGLVCETISGGGTGTCAWEAESGIFTELQPGSYIFMDADYAPNLDEEGRPWHGFEHSLFILTAVMSCRSREYALVDAGTKAANVDIAMPLVCERAGTTYTKASDEHGGDRAFSRGRAIAPWPEAAPDPRTLRSDGQPLRLDRLYPQRHRRSSLAGIRSRCGAVGRRPAAGLTRRRPSPGRPHAKARSLAGLSTRIASISRSVNSLRRIIGTTLRKMWP